MSAIDNYHERHFLSVMERVLHARSEDAARAVLRSIARPAPKLSESKDGVVSDSHDTPVALDVQGVLLAAVDAYKELSQTPDDVFLKIIRTETAGYLESKLGELKDYPDLFMIAVRWAASEDILDRVADAEPHATPRVRIRIDARMVPALVRRDARPLGIFESAAMHNAVLRIVSALYLLLSGSDNSPDVAPFDSAFLRLHGKDFEEFGIAAYAHSAMQLGSSQLMLICDTFFTDGERTDEEKLRVGRKIVTYVFEAMTCATRSEVIDKANTFFETGIVRGHAGRLDDKVWVKMLRELVPDTSMQSGAIELAVGMLYATYARLTRIDTRYGVTGAHKPHRTVTRPRVCVSPDSELYLEFDGDAVLPHSRDSPWWGYELVEEDALAARLHRHFLEFVRAKAGNIGGLVVNVSSTYVSSACVCVLATRGR